MLLNESEAFVGKVYLAVGDGASPENFSRYCEIDSISGIGEKNALVDVTTFCSDGFMEYVSGLSEGTEVTFGANYVKKSASEDRLIQQGLILDVQNKVRRHFTVEIGDDSPMDTMYLSMAMLSWELAPSVAKQNAIKFVGKISGKIVVT